MGAASIAAEVRVMLNQVQGDADSGMEGGLSSSRGQAGAMSNIGGGMRNVAVKLAMIMQ